MTPFNSSSSEGSANPQVFGGRGWWWGEAEETLVDEEEGDGSPWGFLRELCLAMWHPAMKSQEGF